MIVSMKRLSLVALKSDQDAILNALQEAGTVEIIKLADGDVQSGDADAVNVRIQRLAESINAVKPYAKKPGFLSPQKREMKLSDMREYVPKAEQTTNEIEELTHTQARLLSEREKAVSTREALEPWEAMTVPMDTVKNTPRVHYFIGLLASKDVERIREQEYLEAEFMNESATVPTILACKEDDTRIVQNFLKTVEWQDYVFPKLPGTPREAIESLNRRIAEIDGEYDAAQKELEARGETIETLQNALDAETIDADRLSANNDLSYTAHAFVLEGWVRDDEVEKTEQAIKNVTEAYSFEVRDPVEGEEPPSVVKNNRFVKPFEEVQTLYSRPTYGTIDGTPYMTPFYILLFGLMLSDTGYGILLMLGTLLYIKKKKPTGMSAGISRVLFWGGLSTIVWGVLCGSFFGITKTSASTIEVGGVFSQISMFFEKLGIFPALLDPMQNSMVMLGLCFGLGVLHIVAGYIVGAIDRFSKGDWKSAIFDQISWVLITLGLVVGFLPAIAGMAGMSVTLPKSVTMPALIAAGVGALMVVLFKGREKRNILKRMMSGLGGLYDVTSVLADILSYARLFALGIATGVIGQVFNMLCGMLASASNPVMKIVGAIGSIVLLVLLHTFNVAINALGAFVHCARLQYVEFYGKFYESGGKEFRPLSYNTKHVQVTK
ncbi:MAG: V-type ATP synthase subunit I [Clostridia bacterium]|nr:V-type ATP synthase subunit I [Clostridia bacterium]